MHKGIRRVCEQQCRYQLCVKRVYNCMVRSCKTSPYRLNADCANVHVQVLREVAELCKYFARSLHLGHQRIMKPLIGQHVVVRDSEDAWGRMIKMLQGLWSPQRQQTLEVVAVRCHVQSSLACTGKCEGGGQHVMTAFVAECDGSDLLYVSGRRSLRFCGFNHVRTCCFESRE